MNSMLRTSLMAMSLVGFTNLQGCATPHRNEAIGNLVTNNVVRMSIDWGEHADKAWSPASYNVMANYFHWNENSIQYRWIWAEANLRRDVFGKLSHIARVPDQMPLLKHGDLVDVYIPPFESINYGDLRAPVVIRFVCSADDRECKRKSEKELLSCTEN